MKTEHFKQQLEEGSFVLNMRKQFFSGNSGQALVTLLVFMVMAIIITTAAVAVTITNSTTTGKLALGEEAYAVSQAGIDNAVLRLLRDPNYVGETLTVGNGTAVITVSGGASKTITSVGTIGNFSRKIQAGATFNNNVLLIDSWNEID